MAYTAPATELILKEWERKYFIEFVRESGFMPYMGPGANNPIVVKDKLIEGGQVITLPLVTALNSTNVGTGTLTGNEAAIGNSGYDLKPYWHRYAVKVKKSEEHNSVIDLMNAGRDLLKIQDMDDLRDATINALSSVVESSGSYSESRGHSKEVFFSEATTAQKNTWCAANQYRILFGNSEANYNATFATAAANIDTTADTFTTASARLLKFMARRRIRASNIPSIRPIRKGDQGREYFICFHGPQTFKNFKENMQTVNLDGRARDPSKNPVFQDGDLELDGVIHREIPEIPSYGAIGAASATVYPVYFMGAQALGMAWGQKTRATKSDFTDYGFEKGVGIESLWSIEKLRYNGLDHGMITGLFAAT